MIHKKYMKQIYALIDNMLTPDEEQDVREHIAVCEDCRKLHESLRNDDKALQESIDKIAESSGLRERILSATEQPGLKKTSSRRFKLTGYITSGRFAHAVAALFIIAVLIVSGAAFRRERISRFAYVAKMTGLAYCERDGSKYMLSSGNLIRAGDTIYTDRGSKLHLLTVDNDILSINENTVISVGEFKNRQKLHLSTGEIFIDSGENGRKYIITTPTSEVRNLGTRFDIRVMPSELIPSVGYVAVEKGKASVQTRDGDISVNAGEKVVLLNDRVIDRRLSVDEILRWRWSLQNVIVRPSETLWEKEDPVTGIIWVSTGRSFAMPKDDSSDEYRAFSNFIRAMRLKIGRAIEAASIAFTGESIYIGSSYGIFKYDRKSQAINLIIPDYGIVGSDITEIDISENGDVFNLSYRRPGSTVIEKISINSSAFPMVLNFDNQTLNTLVSAN